MVGDARGRMEQRVVGEVHALMNWGRRGTLLEGYGREMHGPELVELTHNGEGGGKGSCGF